jgi:BirA family transcriptional regulator, biotin operon repressor / biotin---[acetyl-CoA-carboxylase] ligase
MEMSELRLKCTDSTNREAMELGFRGAPHGSTVIAAQQDAGKGRLGRNWYSPAGRNLYCSFIVRPVIPIEHYPKLTMVAGVSAAQCLETLAGIRVTLKWPNDIFIGTRKCGGILSEFATDQAGGPFAVVGIGINCNMTSMDLPEDLQAIATSLLIEAGALVDIAALFDDLRSHFLQTIVEFEENGFGSILSHWSRFDHFRGKKMLWVRPGGERLEGENLGPDRDGALMVRDDDGNIHHVVSGEVTSAGTANRH